MCVDFVLDMCADIVIDMCIDIVMDMCEDIVINMCVDMCMDPVPARPHARMPVRQDTRMNMHAPMPLCMIGMSMRMFTHTPTRMPAHTSTHTCTHRYVAAFARAVLKARGAESLSASNTPVQRTFRCVRRHVHISVHMPAHKYAIGRPHVYTHLLPNYLASLRQVSYNMLVTTISYNVLVTTY